MVSKKVSFRNWYRSQGIGIDIDMENFWTIPSPTYKSDGRRADLLSPLSLIGYALLPAGRSDLSDSSEISSRSSIVSNGSVDSVPTAPIISVPSETPATAPANCSQPGMR